MNTSAFTRNVTKNDFAMHVIERSREVLVVADFWAAWCQPCQMLMPVLAHLAEEYEGRFELAKIDTEQERELAAEHGIRSLPTVRLYRHGQAVEEFLGAQPEGVIRNLIERHLPRPSDAVVDSALAMAKSGQAGEAIVLLRQAITDDPTNDRARLSLTKLLVEAATSAVTSGSDAAPSIAEVDTTLGQLNVEQLANPDVAVLKGKLDLLRIASGAPDPATLETTLQKNERDMAARYQLGAIKVLTGDVEAGLQQFLEIVRRDRKFQDDAGRRAMLDVFNQLGNRNPLVQRYRGLLSSALN